MGDLAEARLGSSFNTTAAAAAEVAQHAHAHSYLPGNAGCVCVCTCVCVFVCMKVHAEESFRLAERHKHRLWGRALKAGWRGTGDRSTRRLAESLATRAPLAEGSRRRSSSCRQQQANGNYLL